MKTIGMYMAIAGIASIVLHFMGMNLSLLMWIDMWGATVGWAIRIGLLVIGAGLFFMSPAAEESVEEAPADTNDGA